MSIHSVMNKLDELTATVCSLRPDVVGITESWTNSNIMDSELMLSGYELFRFDTEVVLYYYTLKVNCNPLNLSFNLHFRNRCGVNCKVNLTANY